MSFSNSSQNDPLLLLSFAALLVEAAKWGVTTTNRNRDEILVDLNRASGQCFKVNGNAPTHRSATAYQQNSNA